MVWLNRVIFLSAVVIIGFVGYFSYVAFAPSWMEEEYTISEQDRETGVYYALAVDVDANQDISLQSIMEGDDAILMIKSDSNLLPTPATENGPDYYVFNGARSLHEYDHNFDGTIKANDDVYDDLVLVSKKQYSDNYLFVSLEDSGIDEITFNDDYLSLTKQGQDATANMDIGIATGSSGNELRVQIIPVPVRLLSQ